MLPSVGDEKKEEVEEGITTILQPTYVKVIYLACEGNKVMNLKQE